MAFPPPPPSARQANPEYPAPEEPNGPLPSFEHGTPIGMGFEHVAATEASEVAEENPFQKPNRFREWLKKPVALLKSPRALLRKPSREFTIRAAVGALALTLGWGIGAKPWKPSPSGRTVAAAKASSAKAKTAKTHAAKAAAAKAAPAKAAAGHAVPAAKPAEPVRRVAAMTHAAPAKAQARAATKTKAAPAKKAVIAKSAVTAKASKAKPKAVAKAAIKGKGKAKVKAKAKIAAKPKTNQG